MLLPCHCLQGADGPGPRKETYRAYGYQVRAASTVMHSRIMSMARLRSDGGLGGRVLQLLHASLM